MARGGKIKWQKSELKRTSLLTALFAALSVSVQDPVYSLSSIRRRYYDEHFSTRIDEDYVTLFSHSKEITDTASLFKRGNASSIGFVGADKALWEALIPFFSQKTMMFENSTDERFITIGRELAQNAFN